MSALIERQAAHDNPFEQRLNKYSSLDTQNLPQESALTNFGAISPQPVMLM